MLRRHLKWVLLILTILAILIWIRSHMRLDGLMVIGPNYSIGLASSSGSGGLFLERWYGPKAWNSGWRIHYEVRDAAEELGPHGNTGVYRFGGMGIYSTHTGFLWEFGFFVPYWLVGLAGALMQYREWKHFIQHRRRYVNTCCNHCGYDMRATPDRCPECGKCFRKTEKHI